MIVIYNPSLVLISIFVAIIGALTGLAVSAGYDPNSRRGYAASIIKGAIIVGGSIWAMHFVAMLAVRFPVVVNYNFIETMLSLYIAIMGTGLGLFLVSKRRLGFLSVPVGGLLMGAAISGMHYLGMEAIRGCGITYSETGTIAAITIAVVASGIALWFTFRKRGPAETLGGSLLLGLTIASMHYTAMVATSFQMLPAASVTVEPLLEQDTLAFIIASVAFIICAVFLVMFASLAMSGAPRPSQRGR